MNKLDYSKEQFSEALKLATNVIVDLYTDIDRRPVFTSKTQEEVSSYFDEDLPEHDSSIEEIIGKIERNVLPNVALHYSPHFYAWITSSASQAGIIGEMLSTAINVNATTWLNAPAASEIEQIVIKWMGQFINYSPNAHGVLLSGGSMSNFTALKVCLTKKLDYDFAQSGFDRSKPIRFYTSLEGHHSIVKAVEALGIGRQSLAFIKVNDDYSIDLDDLKMYISRDLRNGIQPIGVIACGGSTNTGTVDPISALVSICKEHNLWLHVDAAYGGFAAATAECGTLFHGLHDADSVTLDLHKWLFTTFECSALLLKCRQDLINSFSHIPVYQKFEHSKNKLDFSELSLQQSRSFKALKVWVTFKAYGTNKLREAISHSINLMSYLSHEINERQDFELFTPHSLSIVCFRYIPKDKSLTTQDLNLLTKLIVDQLIENGEVFIRETELSGVVVFRVCCTNFRRERRHIDYMIEMIRKTGDKILKRWQGISGRLNKQK